MGPTVAATEPVPCGTGGAVLVWICLSLLSVEVSNFSHASWPLSWFLSSWFFLEKNIQLIKYIVSSRKGSLRSREYVEALASQTHRSFSLPAEKVIIHFGISQRESTRSSTRDSSKETPSPRSQGLAHRLHKGGKVISHSKYKFHTKKRIISCLAQVTIEPNQC